MEGGRESGLIWLICMDMVCRLWVSVDWNGLVVGGLGLRVEVKPDDVVA